MVSNVKFHTPRTAARRASLACAMLLSAGGATVARAQAARDTTTLQLSAVLAAAERASPRLEAARAQSRAATARVAVSTRRPNPEVQLGFMNYEVPRVRPMPAIGMVQLQVMQMIPVGGKIRLSGDVASARADAATERIAEAALDVRARTASAFYDLYAADRTLTVAREGKRLVTDLVAIARRMYEVGDGRQADVLRASVELARMDEELIRIETMQSVYAARLNALLGRPHDAPIGMPATPQFPASPISLDSLVRIADEHRPMIRAGVQETRAAGLAAELARREVRPDIQLGLQFGVAPNGGEYERMASVMIGTTMPIFGRSSRYAMRDEALAMQAMSDADVGAMRAETRGAVAEVYADMLRARRLAEHHRSSILPQAEANVASALAAYRAGTVDFSTMLDAQIALNTFRMELIMLDAERGKAWAELEMLSGRRFVDVGSPGSAREQGGSSNE